MNSIFSPFNAEPEEVDRTNRWTAVLVLISIAPLLVALGAHLYFR
jgi:hypothetical protein